MSHYQEYIRNESNDDRQELWRIPVSLMIFTLVLFVILTATAQLAQSQEIPFGQYHGYYLHTEKLPPGALEFGSLIAGSGNTSVNLGDPEMLTVQITGVKYLDVYVSITPPDGDVIVMDGDLQYINDESKSIPVELYAAFANRGVNDPVGAHLITGLGGLFPIFQRESGPPGPPPTPPHEGYTPPMEDAYLYLFGDLDVGNVDAGEYSGEITITIEYN